MSIRAFPLQDHDFPPFSSALQHADLPVEDLHLSGRQFYRFDDGEHVGYGGLEGLGDDLLIRSIVISESRRGHGLGSAIVKAIEREASDQGARRLHLLTTTSANFFRRLGYVDAQRASAPVAIASSDQMRSLCPGSAAYLNKSI